MTSCSVISSRPQLVESQTPLFRFVVDLLWICCRDHNKSTTYVGVISLICRDAVDVDFRFAVDLLYSLLYNKSTTNPTSGVFLGLYTNITVKLKGKVYATCVRSCLMHDSETWPMKVEHELKLNRTGLE